MKLGLIMFTSIMLLAMACMLSGCGNKDQQEVKADETAANAENAVTCAPEDKSAKTDTAKSEDTVKVTVEPTGKPEGISQSDAWKLVKEIDPSKKMIQSRFTGFYNDKFGIATYRYGTLRYTQDGGETWKMGNNKSDCIAGLDIIDEKNAVITANYSEVRVSSDGGANWAEVPNFGDMANEHCRYASFIDQNIGWIANRKEIGATTDGGKSWSNVQAPEGLSDISAIWLSNPEEGYILSTDGKLYATTDGGKGWTEKALGITGLTILVCPTAVLHAEDAQNFQIVAYLENAADKGYFYMSTKDGGATWERKELLAEGGPGFIYLNRDSSLLTISAEKDKIIRLYRASK